MILNEKLPAQPIYSAEVSEKQLWSSSLYVTFLFKYQNFEKSTAGRCFHCIHSRGRQYGRVPVVKLIKVHKKYIRGPKDARELL